MIQDHVAVPGALGTGDIVDEPLHEYTVNAVILHPFEMAQHRLAIEGTENFRRPAIGVRKRGGKAFIRIHLADIRPKINTATARLKAVPPCKMRPASASSVSRRAEPSLISAHHFPGERVAIHTRMVFPLVWPHGMFDHPLEIHAIGITPILEYSRNQGSGRGCRLVHRFRA